MQTKHTMGPELHHNTYHVDVIRSHLTQNLSVLYPEIRDEVSVAFDEVLDLRGNGEWYNSFIANFLAEVGNCQNGRAYVPSASSKRLSVELATDYSLGFHYVRIYLLYIAASCFLSLE